MKKMDFYTRKLRKGIYYLFNFNEVYEGLYLRFRCRLKTLDLRQLAVCRENGYRIEEKYGALRKMLARKSCDSLYLGARECMEAVRRNEPSPAFAAKYEELLQEIENIPVREFTSERWRTIARILCENGLFRAQSLCRRKSQERLLLSKGRYARKIVAYLENKDLYHAETCINQLCRHRLLAYSLGSEIQSYKLYYNLLSGSGHYPVDGAKSRNWDPNFGALIKGKSIRIIGPAAALEHCKEDDEYLIRINASEEEIQKQEIDAAYFTPHVAEELFAPFEKVKLAFHGKICVYDYDGSGRKINRMRLSAASDELYYMGSMNAVQQILADIWMNWGGAVPYVEGTTLYLSEKVYCDNYVNKSQRGEESYKLALRIWLGQGHHNPQSQFLFLKNLYSAGCFKADDKLSDILDLSVEEYLDGMERLYPFYRIFAEG